MSFAASSCSAAERKLDWQALPALPVLGIAGAFVGVSGDELIVAGGANFPVKPNESVWGASKVWRDEVYVLSLSEDAPSEWKSGLRLNRPVAYGMTVSTPHGMVCMGGEDSKETFKECFLLNIDEDRLVQTPLPDLPQPCSYGAAAVIGDTVYLAGGQGGRGLDSALHNFWALNLSLLKTGSPEFCWKELPAWPGPERTLNLTVAQYNGAETCVYVISGHGVPPAAGEKPGSDIFQDVYEFSPKSAKWCPRSNIPEAVFGGTAAAVGRSQLFVLSGVDHATAALPPNLQDWHPGLPRRTWVYDTATDVWAEAGPSPENQIVTTAVVRNDEIFLVSGEIKPRIRSRNAWCITVRSKSEPDIGRNNEGRKPSACIPGTN